MLGSDLMQYNLVMKISHNNYQPFDYYLLDKYTNEDLKTLEGIDAFCSKYKNEAELKKDLLIANFIDANDLEKELKIIFYENKNKREYKYELCFAEEIKYIGVDNIIKFLAENIDQPLILNKIYNEFQKRKQLSGYFIRVLKVLKNIKKADNVEWLNFIAYLSYEERRSLGMYIYKNFYDIIKNIEQDGDNYEIKKLRMDRRKSV